MQKQNFKNKNIALVVTIGATMLFAVTLFGMLLSCGGENNVETAATSTETFTATTKAFTTAETTVETTVEVTATEEETVIPMLIDDAEYINYPPDSPEYMLFDMFKNDVPSVREQRVETILSEPVFDPEATGEPTVAEPVYIEVAEEYYRSGNAALYYHDISLDKTIVVNGDKKISSASMIKAPYVYTLLVCADEGLVDLDEERTYNSTMFVDGTGVFKDFKDGSVFTVRELISYTMRYSDNTAYSMLRKRFGSEYFTLVMEKAGISEPDYSKWYSATALQYGEFFTLLAAYLSSDSENAKWLKEEMINSNQTVMLQKALEPDTVAHKYGWDEDSYCDGGVVFSDNGVYAVVFMSDLDGGSGYIANTKFIYKAGEYIRMMRQNDYQSEMTEQIPAKADE